MSQPAGTSVREKFSIRSDRMFGKPFSELTPAQQRAVESASAVARAVLEARVLAAKQ